MRWLAGLVLIEAGLVAAGLLTGAEPDVRPAPVSSRAAIARAEAPGVPYRALAGQLLARPLFMPGRRAAPEVLALPAEADTPQLPRLTGIVVAGALRRAVFARPGEAGPGEAGPVSVGEGDRVGPFLVAAIGADRVELTGPLGSRVMRPGRDGALREQFASAAGPVPLIDPYRRELETENDQ